MFLILVAVAYTAWAISLGRPDDDGLIGQLKAANIFVPIAVLAIYLRNRTRG